MQRLKPDPSAKIEDYADTSNPPRAGEIVTIQGITRIVMDDDGVCKADWVAAWLKVPETPEAFWAECNRIFNNVHFESWEYGKPLFEQSNVS